MMIKLIFVSEWAISSLQLTPLIVDQVIDIINPNKQMKEMNN
jgi:hypothetical protein